MSAPAHYTLSPLPFYQLVSVSGSDAAKFLQNQLSNDIEQLSDTHSQLSSYSSAKGMMYSNFRIFQRNQDYILRLPTDITEAVTKRLRMFVLRDDVQITIENELLIYGLSGSDSLSALERLSLTAPENMDGISHNDDIQVIRAIAAVNEHRFELIIPSAKANHLSAMLNGEESDYLSSQIRAGEAVITQANYEQWVAQNLNLELINGVSFKKGCYPGQEYIARTQYRGQVRSRTYLIQSNADMPAGTELFETGKTDAEAIGKIINSEHCNDKVLALAVIRNRQAEKQNVCLADSSVIEVLNLPYHLSGDESNK